MVRIHKFIEYLKPYKFTMVVLFIGFIFQQICSLSLPLLMSDIVDRGIRQGGIKEESPQIISFKSFEITKFFMLDKEKETLKNSYVLIDDNNFKRNNAVVSKNNLAVKLNLLGIFSSNGLKDGIYILNNISIVDHKYLGECFLNSTSRLLKYINSSPDKNGLIYPDDHKYNFLINIDRIYELTQGLTPISDTKLSDIDNLNLGDFDPHQATASLNRQFYDELGVDTLEIQRNYILKIGLLMILVTFISLIFVVIQNYYSAKMSAGISLNLRKDVFEKVHSFSEKEFDKISVSSLVTRTTHDISQVKGTLLMGINFVTPPIMFIAGIVMAVKKSVSMSWTIILGSIIAAAIIITVYIIIFPKAKIMQELIDKFNLIVRERLSGLMVISSLGNLGVEEKRFDNENKKLSSISKFVNKTTMLMTPFLTVSMNLINVLIIWLGTKQISISAMKIGDLMAFTQYSAMVIGAFLILVMMFSSLPHALISINRVLEILESDSSIKDPEKPVSFKTNFGAQIQFNNVCFSYGDNRNYVINDMSFTLIPGQITGIIGPTGSGKSTLVKLIPRFYDVASGEILLDNINIKDVTQYNLREKVSYVPQKSVLFTGDILYNIKYGNQHADEDKINECAKISNILELVSKQNDQVSNKLISREGNNLSGGQCQRVCLARSLVRDSSLYIFDDSFSSLDFNTESEIRGKLFKYLKNKSVIVVSQRVSTIMESDKIIVLKQGKIVGEGTHKDLIKECSDYREIVLSQMPEEVSV